MDSYDKVSLLLPMNGPNNGTVFDDWSPVPKTVTRAGAVTKTDQTKHYDSSGYFDGSSFLEFPDSADFRFGSGDFTIEAWVRLPEFVSQTILSKRGATTNEFHFRFNASGRLIFSGWVSSSQVSVESITDLPVDAWRHIAVAKHSGIVKIYENGTQQESGTIGSIDTTSNNVFVGKTGAEESDLIGHVQDLRVVKGAALYTANFTPPSRLLGTLSNTNGDPITDENGLPVQRKIFAVPRSYFGAGGVGRIWSTESGADGRYELWAPAGVDHSRIIVAQDSGSPGPGDPVLPDLIDRVIPA